ncbi:cysteine--tRNA ligase [Pseudanabaena sp. ABRG5-3]|uniref:cysteine--tRNA ligase n=1 Tax=Pseudanabaena sp. ABRG5-3 TaxID=685565 RepID=UPI000DC72998|nr:cysteine--tRNA ligase [Pseudanabaena sp. ABRG5-3]BBC23098.1 cysteinyl-tRNA synthetase [Pseudanabaena sp. ABRG5-3]
MTLRIYNTLTRRKEEFIPLEAGIVKMYVCGVTVYDYCHLGHARAYVVWDMIRRYLTTKYQVKFVQNITDIDDKILRRALERETTMQAIANQYIATYDEDMAKLNIAKADDYPRATETIPEIIDLIQKLIDHDYAYAAGGDVYYAVQKFPNYGKLSGRKLEDMQAGASGRVDEQEEQKRYPFDFALWKAAKPNEPFWESPWGKGRPGWHIECSAMVRSRLGDTIDIHAGGSDLQFPHHENEIAQSEAASHQPLANYWMHNGFVNIDGEKMSKSLNNFTTIRDLFGYFDPMAIRLFILQAQYRQPIDFTEEAINAATKGWETVRDGMLFAADFGKQLGWASSEVPLREDIAEAIACFEEAMNDDFNTSVAMSHVFELAKKLRAERNSLSHSGKTAASSEVLFQDWQALSYMTNILGFVANVSDRQVQEDGISEAEIEALIQQRIEAKKAKNYKESDRIRDELKALGITLVDQKDGTTLWLRA